MSRGLARRVLYIEDNPVNLRLMERILSRRPGIIFCGSFDAEEGLKSARELKPDLILLDLHLPGISGEKLLLQLKADPRLQKIPVIIVTADASSNRSEQLLAKGAAAFVTKPFHIDSILSVIEHHLYTPSDCA